MLNRWFLCFTFIGIIFACQHGACANRGEDTEKRTNSSDSDDSANVDVVIEITEKPKTYNATQNTLGIPDEGTNKSSEMACPNSWGNGNPKMEYTCPSTLCQHISYGCKTHCPADGDGYNCGVLAKCGIKISDDAYAWVMVFVLPINAAVNPFLYTVTAIWRKRRREQNRSTSMTSTTRRQLRQSEVIAKETNGT
ncbi:uncharacterized protein LOC110452930 isoform X2 [Mizuhopecten yessoensis]|uniref:uncharacterized protein LOC110452930 isoform X2 n=1 Tax=Mizuhopecten yessoensis TaxID=6573 RepID=UPI000B45AA07|nr:uncharacterized protein LOC110452930 isoform X2 [Mizuhopecten yessoensis]